jgi:hypothetical protein
MNLMIVGRVGLLACTQTVHCSVHRSGARGVFDELSCGPEYKALAQQRVLTECCCCCRCVFFTQVQELCGSHGY